MSNPCLTPPKAPSFSPDYGFEWFRYGDPDGDEKRNAVLVDLEARRKAAEYWPRPEVFPAPPSMISVAEEMVTETEEQSTIVDPFSVQMPPSSVGLGAVKGKTPRKKAKEKLSRPAQAQPNRRYTFRSRRVDTQMTSTNETVAVPVTPPKKADLALRTNSPTDHHQPASATRTPRRSKPPGALERLNRRYQLRREARHAAVAARAADRLKGQQKPAVTPNTIAQEGIEEGFESYLIRLGHLDAEMSGVEEA